MQTTESFGEYKNRDSAVRSWTGFRGKPTPHLLRGVSELRNFYFTLDYFNKPMDFFNNVIPHMRGKGNKARGQVATLIGTGSTMAVDITATNRQASDGFVRTAQTGVVGFSKDV